jgi:rRNA maturation protein Nop10
MLQKRCPNDNHGRMVVRVRCCPNCGEVLNANIAPRHCAADAHAKMRRYQSTYCTDCGARLG